MAGCFLRQGLKSGYRIFIDFLFHNFFQGSTSKKTEHHATGKRYVDLVGYKTRIFSQKRSQYPIILFEIKSTSDVEALRDAMVQLLSFSLPFRQAFKDVGSSVMVLISPTVWGIAAVPEIEDELPLNIEFESYNVLYLKKAAALDTNIDKYYLDRNNYFAFILSLCRHLDDVQ